MKPTLRLTIQPMTDRESAEQILTDLACDFAQFGAIILAMGGTFLMLFALAAD